MSVCVWVQVNCSRMASVCSFGSVTAWTRWGRFGQPVAGTRWTVTTAAALTDSSSAPITAARGPACGARGPAGHRAAFPADPARKPDIGDEKKNVVLYSTLVRGFLIIHIRCSRDKYLCGRRLSGPWSQMPKVHTASLRKSSINLATQDPARPCVSMTVRKSAWDTPGCRESVNNGETEKKR